MGITDDRDVNHLYWATLISDNMLSSRRASVRVAWGRGCRAGVDVYVRRTLLLLYIYAFIIYILHSLLI